jgi:hypothetical protein
VWVQAEDAKQQVKVDLPSLTPGIYTLRVFGKEAVQVSKMVIE